MAETTVTLSNSISEEALQSFYKEGLFKLFVPLNLGGREVSLPEALRLFEKVAYHDGSQGWLVAIGAGGGYFVPFFQEEVATHLFSPQTAVLAGSGAVTGVARRVAGGYVVTGDWKFCSGSDYASFFTANCRIEETDSMESCVMDKSASVRAFIFLPDQVSITPDWNAFGLQATSSHTISVREQFVPDEMTFDFANKHHYHDAPLYQYPYLPFAVTSFTAVCLGIARHFLDEAQAIVETKRSQDEWYREQRYPVAERVITEMQGRVGTKASTFYQVVEQSWAENITQPREEVTANVVVTAKSLVQLLRESVSVVYPYLGMVAVSEQTLIQQIWRDFHTASQHSLLSPFE